MVKICFAIVFFLFVCTNEQVCLCECVCDGRVVIAMSVVVQKDECEEL